MTGRVGKFFKGVGEAVYAAPGSIVNAFSGSKKADKVGRAGVEASGSAAAGQSPSPPSSNHSSRNSSSSHGSSGEVVRVMAKGKTAHLNETLRLLKKFIRAIHDSSESDLDEQAKDAGKSSSPKASRSRSNSEPILAAPDSPESVQNEAEVPNSEEADKESPGIRPPKQEKSDFEKLIDLLDEVAKYNYLSGNKEKAEAKEADDGSKAEEALEAELNKEAKAHLESVLNKMKIMLKQQRDVNEAEEADQAEEIDKPVTLEELEPDLLALEDYIEAAIAQPNKAVPKHDIENAESYLAKKSANGARGALKQVENSAPEVVTFLKEVLNNVLSDQSDEKLIELQSLLKQFKELDATDDIEKTASLIKRKLQYLANKGLLNYKENAHLYKKANLDEARLRAFRENPDQEDVSRVLDLLDYISAQRAGVLEKVGNFGLEYARRFTGDKELQENVKKLIERVGAQGRELVDGQAHPLLRQLRPLLKRMKELADIVAIDKANAYAQNELFDLQEKLTKVVENSGHHPFSKIIDLSLQNLPEDKKNEDAFVSQLKELKGLLKAILAEEGDPADLPEQLANAMAIVEEHYIYQTGLLIRANETLDEAFLKLCKKFEDVKGILSDVNKETLPHILKLAKITKHLVREATAENGALPQVKSILEIIFPVESRGQESAVKIVAEKIFPPLVDEILPTVVDDVLPAIKDDILPAAKELGAQGVKISKNVRKATKNVRETVKDGKKVAESVKDLFKDSDKKKADLHPAIYAVRDRLRPLKKTLERMEHKESTEFKRNKELGIFIDATERAIDNLIDKDKSLSEDDIQALDDFKEQMVKLFNKDKKISFVKARNLKKVLLPALKVINDKINVGETLVEDVMRKAEDAFTDLIDKSGHVVSKYVFGVFSAGLFGFVDYILNALPEKNEKGEIIKKHVKARAELKELLRSVEAAQESGDGSEVKEAFKKVYDKLEGLGIRWGGLDILPDPAKRQQDLRTDIAHNIKGAKQHLQLNGEAKKMSKKRLIEQLDKEKAKLIKNYASYYTLQAIWEGVCGQKAKTTNFYRNMVREAGGDGDILRTKFFKQIDKDKNISGIKKVWAKFLYVAIVGPAIRHMLGKYANNIFSAAQKYVKGQSEEDKFVDLTNRLFNLADDYMSGLNNLLDKFAKTNHAPSGSRQRYVDEQLELPKYNAGFALDELYQTLGDSTVSRYNNTLGWTKGAIDATIGQIENTAGRAALYVAASPFLLVMVIIEGLLLDLPFIAIQQKVLKWTNAIESGIDLVANSVQDKHGYSNALTSFLYEQLIEVWKASQSPNKPEVDDENNFSETKKQVIKKILHNLNEVNEKMRTYTRNQQFNHTFKPSVFEQLANLVKDPATEAVINRAADDLVASFSQALANQDFNQILYNGIVSFNKPFDKKKKKVTDDESKRVNKRLEQDFDDLLKSILNHNISKTVEELFYSGVEKHQVAMTTTLMDLKKRSRKFGNKAKNEFARLEDMYNKDQKRAKKQLLGPFLRTHEEFISETKSVVDRAKTKQDLASSRRSKRHIDKVAFTLDEQLKIVTANIRVLAETTEQVEIDAALDEIHDALQEFEKQANAIKDHTILNIEFGSFIKSLTEMGQNFTTDIVSDRVKNIIETFKQPYSIKGVLRKGVVELVKETDPGKYKKIKDRSRKQRAEARARVGDV